MPLQARSKSLSRQLGVACMQDCIRLNSAAGLVWSKQTICFQEESSVEIPNLNDVRTFVVIGQAGTLTAAAKELNLPTSTVSRSLTRLEQHLNVLLAQRTPRGLTLTDFGKEYLHTCRRALRALRDGSDLLQNRRARPSGLLKVACPVTMAPRLVAPPLKEFLARYPELR